MEEPLWLAGRRAERMAAASATSPGQALAKLWNERGSGVPARSADEFGSATAVVDWVRAAVESA